MASGEDPNAADTKRLDFKKQSLDDAYAAPANLLEIEVCDPDAHGFGRQRYTDYEVKMRVGIFILLLWTSMCVLLTSSPYAYVYNIALLLCLSVIHILQCFLLF